MALALTPFEALCGFRPLNEIVNHLNKYPELAELVGAHIANDFISTVGDINSNEEKNKAALKSLFGSLMKSKDQDVTKHLNALIARLNSSSESSLDALDKLVLRLDQQYPGGDVGVFACLFLNYVVMTPGEAMFLCANEPHAYLSGGKSF